MSMFNFQNIDIRLWRKYLPFLCEHNQDADLPHDYYATFFKDALNNRYALHAYTCDKSGVIQSVSLRPLPHGDVLIVSINNLPDMAVEIIHYRKNVQQHYANIFFFAVDRRFKIISAKNLIIRAKARLPSASNADKETITQDRYNLLQLLVTQYINQCPSRLSSGFRHEEIIALLYGTLWYKHIQNEAYSRRLKLLLESLVLSGDLLENNDVYFVQGQAITTIVEFEKEDKRVTQQLKMHKSIVRFTAVMTIATLMIIMVLLAMAGVVDLSAVWHKILEIKPIRFLLKFL
ncbi:TPA: hypothetical protein JG914_004796 [Enterobacter hormaechei subsp. steigerwaltii]|nr:hypothetical protein [Enterobacter hormaechei subsp. steigerwaltii]